MPLTPPVDHVRDREAEAKDRQSEIDNHGPLAQREGAGGEAQAAGDAGDDAEAEWEHDGQDHEGDGDLPEQGVVQVPGEDLDGVHAEVRGDEGDGHVDGDEEADDAGDLVLLEFFEGFGLVGGVSWRARGSGRCLTCCWHSPRCTVTRLRDSMR